MVKPVDAKITEAHTKASNKAALTRGKFFFALAVFAVVNALLLSVPALKLRRLDASAFNDLERAKQCGMPGAWWMARDYFNQSKPPDLVIFGSSQMGGLQAADAQTLNRNIDFVDYHRAATVEQELDKRLGGSFSSFTLALPGSMASDHYIVSRALFTNQSKPKLAIVGLSPRDFMDNFLPAPGATEQFRYFSKFVELGDLSAVAFPDPIARIDWFLTEKMPLRRLVTAIVPAALGSKTQSADSLNPGSTLRDAIGGTATASGASQHVFRNQLLTAIYTSSGDIKPGQCLVKPKMPDYFVDNTLEYKRRYRKTNPPVYGQEMIFFNKFLALMNEEHVAVLVIGMPLVASNRAQLPPQFWTKFRSDIAATCSRYGAFFDDYSDSTSFDMHDFVDTVHLNARGGVKLAKIMAQEVAAQPRLALALGPNSGRAAASKKIAACASSAAR